MTTLLRNGKPDTPSGLKVAPQSYAGLEKAARQLDGVLPCLPGERYKLDCVKILEGTLANAGYKLRVVEVGQVDDCAAFTIPEMEILVFRQDVYDLLHDDHVFGRSTVVHELSHLVLGHSITLHRGATLGKHQFYEDSEWQAKSLTAAIMMPIDACRIARSAHDLAELCGTSVQAATYRLERLTKDGIIS